MNAEFKDITKEAFIIAYREQFWKYYYSLSSVWY